MPINSELLNLLACPMCMASLKLHREEWLVCSQCHCKYPIKNEIPVLLIEVGKNYKDTPVERLPDANML